MNTIFRHGTYNLLDYGEPDNDETRERLALVRKTIVAADCDAWSVQELFGRTPAERYEIFTGLAASLGMECMATGAHDATPAPVFDPGQGIRGVGVMWRPDRIQPVPGSLRTYENAGLGVGMALVRLRIGDVVITVAATHWRPRFPNQSADEGVYTSMEIVNAGTHGILGADFNKVFASDDDPYAELSWQPHHIAAARPNQKTGCGIARREPMQELADGGLFDPAAYIDAHRFHTAGHWNERAIPQRIDGPMVTKSVAQATRSITAVNDETAQKASDHLPVILEVEMDRLAAAA